jgi:hypothetical protein
MHTSGPTLRNRGERPHKIDSKFDPFRTIGGARACQPYTHQVMNALRILFTTSRFNLSKVGDHFINPCCFGEDLAAWLRVKLIERKVEVPQLYQEDWGWELQANRGLDSYYLCVSGNADGSNTNKDEGEWGIIVEKKRSLWQRLSGKGRIARNDEMTGLIEEILSDDPTVRDVHREE